MSDTPRSFVEASCPNCWKPSPLCLCAEITPFETRTRLLLLQHPSEARNPLSSARLLALATSRCRHRVGLSWPSLSKAVGEKCDPHEWGVLYLGPLKDMRSLKEDVPFQVVGKGGKPVAPSGLKGLVFLDGNWKQSKTLWWRNPWFLKLNRVMLNPELTSRYAEVRKQPRKACLSTLEAAAESLDALGEDPKAGASLRSLFEHFVERARTGAA